MGVYLGLSIIPERITDGEWAAVYQETLKLTVQYPFMDIARGERNGMTYPFVRQAQHCSNVEGGYDGWQSVGDLRTFAGTERFTVLSDLEAYRKSSCRAKDNGADVWLGDLHCDIDVTRPSTSSSIWFSKTCGRDSWKYLIAVACLIISRFPDAAEVSYDVNAALCREAVNWANQYLDSPIDVPDTAVREKLLKRLVRTGVPRQQLLNAFLQLTIEEKDPQMGQFISAEFSDEEIHQYYKGRLAIEGCADDAFFEYLYMGFDFDGLCDIIAEEGASDLAKTLLENERKARQHGGSTQYSYYDFYGRARQTSKEIQEEQRAKYEKYDIVYYEDLRKFTPGCKIDPDLEAHIKENFAAVRREGIEEAKTFAGMGKIERENWFIQNVGRLSLTEDTWDYIFDRVMDDHYIRRFIALFAAPDYTFGGMDSMDIIINHIPVLDYYWEGSKPATWN